MCQDKDNPILNKILDVLYATEVNALISYTQRARALVRRMLYFYNVYLNILAQIKCISLCTCINLMRLTDRSLFLQDGFAPPDDEEIEEAAQGDQEEF